MKRITNKVSVHAQENMQKPSDREERVDSECGAAVLVRAVDCSTEAPLFIFLYSYAPAL